MGIEIRLRVDRLVGFCAHCGYPSEPVFCSKKCEREYVEWRVDQESELETELHPERFA